MSFTKSSKDTGDNLSSATSFNRRNEQVVPTTCLWNPPFPPSPNSLAYALPVYPLTISRHFPTYLLPSLLPWDPFALPLYKVPTRLPNKVQAFAEKTQQLALPATTLCLASCLRLSHGAVLTSYSPLHPLSCFNPLFFLFLCAHLPWAPSLCLMSTIPETRLWVLPSSRRLS